MMIAMLMHFYINNCMCFLKISLKLCNRVVCVYIYVCTFLPTGKRTFQFIFKFKLNYFVQK